MHQIANYSAKSFMKFTSVYIYQMAMAALHTRVLMLNASTNTLLTIRHRYLMSTSVFPELVHLSELNQ
jgi:hypothetical protein